MLRGDVVTFMYGRAGADSWIKQSRFIEKGAVVVGIWLACAIIAILCWHLNVAGKRSMANLSVRRVDDDIVAKLRIRAARHGVSMEEEVRRMLEQAVSAPARLGDVALELFGEDAGVELELIERAPHEPVDLTS